MTHERADKLITNSMLGTAKTCKRKGFLNHRLMLEHKARPIPFRRGGAVHAVMQNFYQSRLTDPKALSRIAIDVYREGVEHSAPYMTTSDTDRMEKDEALVGGLAYAYVDHYESDLDDWEIIAVEEQIRTKLVEPRTKEIHPNWDYGMVLDLVVRSRSTGKYILVEHKTAGQLNDVYWRKLDLDPQLSGYWLGAHARGWPIDHVIYNVILMPGIRQKKTENRQQYYDRLHEEMTLNSEKYFHRRVIHRTREQLVEFLRNAWDWADELDVMWDQPMEKWLKSDILACVQFNRLCPFADICAFGLEGPHMMAYDVRKNQHPEYVEED